MQFKVQENQNFLGCAPDFAGMTYTLPSLDPPAGFQTSFLSV